MDIKDAAISFGISYLANNIPAVNEFLKQHVGLDKEIADCYQRAVYHWNCAAVRDKYLGRSVVYLDDLKSYVQGKTLKELPNEVQELLGEWVNEIRQSETCRVVLLEWKLDGVLSSIDGGAELAALIASLPIFKEIHQTVSKLSHEVSDIQAGVELIIDEITSSRPGAYVPKDMDDIMREYFCSPPASVVVEAAPTCTNKQDALMALYYVLIEVLSTLDHFVYSLCCRGGLSWYSNKGIPELLEKVFAKIEDFANANRYYISEDLYSMLRQHIIAGQDVVSEFQTFVMTLENTCEEHEEKVLDIFDEFTYGRDGLKIDDKFVSAIMNAFYNIEQNYAFISFAKAYKQFLTSSFRLMEIAKG